MKIVLIFPNYLDNFLLIRASFYPPLGIALIAAVLKQAGHTVSVIDATALRLNIHALATRVLEEQPDIIGITCNIAYARKAVIIARWLRQRIPGVPVVFGGPWATCRFEKLLRDHVADYVVLGEGEVTIVELMRAIARGTPLQDVKGIAYLQETRVMKTEPRPHIDDLDSLPFPAWELFPSHRKYFWDPKGTRFYPVMTSRGCPFGCINCTKLVHGYKLRYRSVGNVIEEIQYLKENFKADEIIVIDDAFNYDANRAEEICDNIIKLKLNVHLRFTNGLRADMLPPRLAWKLKQAGAYDIVLGIESGNQELVYRIGKKLDLRQVLRSVRLLKRLGIFTSGFFMIGVPGETVKTMLDTKRFARSLDLDIALISRAIPFPGTKMYDMVKKSGRFTEDFEERLTFYHQGNPMFEIEGLPVATLESGFQDIYRSFYFNFRRFFKLVTKIRLKNWRVYLNFTLITILNIFQKRFSRNEQ